MARASGAARWRGRASPARRCVRQPGGGRRRQDNPGAVVLPRSATARARPGEGGAETLRGTHSGRACRAPGERSSPANPRDGRPGGAEAVCSHHSSALIPLAFRGSYPARRPVVAPDSGFSRTPTSARLRPRFAPWSPCSPPPSAVSRPSSGADSTRRSSSSRSGSSSRSTPTSSGDRGSLPSIAPSGSRRPNFGRAGRPSW